MKNLNNINMERSLISYLLYNTKCFKNIVEIVTEKDFYFNEHKNIFLAMRSCFKKNPVFDEEFIKIELLNRKCYDESIFAEILFINASESMIINYAKEIRIMALKREILNNFNQITGTPSYSNIRSIMNKLFLMSSINSTNIASSVDIVNSTVEMILKNKKNIHDKIQKFDTGYNHLNHFTSNLERGSLVLIASTPNIGKTSLVLNIARNLIYNNEGVIIFSFNDTRENIMMKLLSSSSSIAIQSLLYGNMNDDEWSRLNMKMDEISQKNLFICTETSSLSTILNNIHKIKSKSPEIKTVIVDSLQSLKNKKNKKWNLKAEKICYKLKSIAKELNINILLTSNIISNKKKRRPILKDIKEYDYIYKYTDLIIFIYRDIKYILENKPDEDMELIISKNKYGKEGISYLTFQKSYLKFIDTKKYNGLNI